MKLNQIVENLPKYPMEELAKIRRSLISENKTYYDFGTGDPKLQTPDFIREALRNSVPEISQYPSIIGTPSLHKAIHSYIKRIIILLQKSLKFFLPQEVRKLSFIVLYALLAVTTRKQ